MKYKITFKNPATGEDESKTIIKPEDWDDSISAIYEKMIPDGKIKPVNVKIELIFGAE